MKAAGLKGISCRMNDRVTVLDPVQEEYAEILDSIVRADHWNDEKTDKEIEENIAHFMNHGMSRKDAEDYCRQQNGIVRFLKRNVGEVALTKMTGLMISYGWKG